MPQFIGVAHVHSTYSFDGHLTIEELTAFFKKRGIAFVLMSEHVESLDDPEKVRAFIADCEKHSGPSLLLIPGIEIDALNALFYGVSAIEGWISDEDLAKQLADNGALVAISHPVKIRDLPGIDPVLVEAVEIWNSRHDGKIALNPGIVEFWRKERRRLNRPLLALCGIDFHGENDFVPLVMSVTCEHLSRSNIMSAIRGGQHRIRLSRREIPLNSFTGSLSWSYRLYSTPYRWAYSAIYALHRRGLRVPRRLKSLLRRIF